MPFAVLNWKSMHLFSEWLDQRLCVKTNKIAYKINDKFKPEVENTGAFPLVLAKGNVQLCRGKKKKKF